MKQLLPLTALVLILGCSKEDNEKPVITVTSPNNNQVFTAGQTVPINITITDNDELHGVHMMVSNAANGDHVIHMEEHVDLKTYTITNSFPAAAGIQYKIQVSADDHAGNTQSLELLVKGQ